MQHLLHSFAIFADDVRLEASGKSTYVGVYQDNLYFFGPPPWSLPQFCIQVYFREAVPIGTKVVFELRALNEDGESVVFRAEDAQQGNVIQLPPFTSERDMPVHLSFAFQFRFAPLVVEKPVRFSVVAIYEDGREVLVDRLRLQAQPDILKPL